MATETELVPISGVNVTLYDAEESLQTLLDSEALATDEQKAEFKTELAAALKTAVDKRDRVAQFRASLRAQIELGKQEQKRIADRTAFFEGVIERLEEYIVGVILDMGTDDKGKYRKLEGRTATLAVKRNPPSVDIQDEAAVPLEYKDASVSARCPADRWERAVEEVIRPLWEGYSRDFPAEHDAKQVMSLILDPKNVKHSVRKSDVKKAIDGGAEVPGADVAMGSYRLEVK